MSTSRENNNSYVAGRFVAVNYSLWSVQPTGVAKGVTGVQSFTVINPLVTLPDGRSFLPFNTNAPINFGGEILTPSHVTYTDNNTRCTLTCDFTFTHNDAQGIASGTYGLQEALNDAAAFGGLVTIDGQWKNIGGTDAMKADAIVPSGVAIEDVRNGSGSDAVPGGVSGDLQYNDAGVFGGASGGTTNGTHFAFGDGSTIDSVPAVSPDGNNGVPPKAIQCLEETYTGADLENGEYLGLTLNPSATPTGLYPIGKWINLTLADGPNFAANPLSIVGSWTSLNSLVNSPNTINAQLSGFVGGVYNNGSADLGQLTAIVGEAQQNGSGTVSQLKTFLAIYGVHNNGTVTQGMGLELLPFVDAGCTFTNINQIQIDTPVNNGTIGEIVGLYIQDQSTAGTSTVYPIKSDGADTSLFAGPIALPYTQAQTVYSAAGTALPSASDAGIGARAFVSDATANVYGTDYASGGSINAPVYSDGSTWIMG